MSCPLISTSQPASRRRGLLGVPILAFGLLTSCGVSVTPTAGVAKSADNARLRGLVLGSQRAIAGAPTSSPGVSHPNAALTGFNIVMPAMTVSLQNSSVSVGRTTTGTVTLGQPAGTGGVTISLASSSTAVSLSPSEMTVAARQSTASFTVNGLASGSSTISATALSYTPASHLVIVVPFTSSGSSVTTVQSLGAIPVTQPLTGLGFNLKPDNAWEFAMAAAAGATHARFQCSWSDIENQSAPPNNTDQAAPFTFNEDCVEGFASASKYNLHPTVVTAYGPPYHAILNFTLPAGAAAKATSLNISFASGVGGDTLASLKPFYDAIINANGNQLTNINSYAGGLITAVTVTSSTTATIRLASGLSTALPAGSSQYTVNEYLYPPPASSSPSDPSVQAYARYVEWLAGQVHARGLTCEIEVWNEPPWPWDPWDNRGDFYDIWPGAASPGPQMQGLPNFGFVAALQAQSSHTPGVTYNWGGTEKDGFVSLASNFPGYTMQDNSGVRFIQPNSLFTTESFHPYGNNPEQDIWSNTCLAATLNTYPTPPNNTWIHCALVPGSTSNFSYAVQSTLYQQSRKPSWGIGHNITETGFSTVIEGDESHQARFVIRQFLGYQADGVTPVQFYRLYDDGGTGFGFLNPVANRDGTHSPLESYTAIAGLMSDFAKIGNRPVAAYPASSLASVVSYRGTYPLDTVHMVGSRAGDTANSDLMTLWQQSTTSGKWATLAPPAPAPVTVKIPTGLSVAAAVDTVTRIPVPYATNGQEITFDASDDPIELLLEPVQTAMN